MFKGRGGSQKLPLARALSIHVLHLISRKGIAGGAKSKALVDEVLYLLWRPYLSLQPSLSSPFRTSPLLFDFALSSVCWKSWLCCSHWAFWVSVRRIVLFLSVWWEKLGKTMSGGRARPLWCPFHPPPPFSLFKMTAMISADLLQVCTIWHLVMLKSHLRVHEHMKWSIVYAYGDQLHGLFWYSLPIFLVS